MNTVNSINKKMVIHKLLRSRQFNSGLNELLHFGNKLLHTFLITTFFSVSAYGQIQLSSVFSDSMVLQRHKPIVFCGRGNNGEKLHVQFAGKSTYTKVKSDGTWEVNFPPLPEGGPYSLSIFGKNSIRINDIWMGDVWFCSGQSNMEWKIGALESNAVLYFYKVIF